MATGDEVTEKPEPQTADEWRTIAEFLFARLDDIDTLYDACKGDERAFYAQVSRVHPKRFRVAETDGYSVRFFMPTTGEGRVCQEP